MLAGSDEDRVCMGRCFIRQRCNMQAAERYVGSTRTIVVRDPVRPIGIGDIDLNDHQVGLVVEVELLDVLILQRDLKIRIQVCSESCQAKWRK